MQATFAPGSTTTCCASTSASSSAPAAASLPPRWSADADQVKLVVVAVLAAFFQNCVMIAHHHRADAGAVGAADAAGAGAGAAAGVRRADAGSSGSKRHAQAFAHERGELTATVTERLGAMKLIRAFGAEAGEASGVRRPRPTAIASGYVRTQRFALLTSPVSELFGGAIDHADALGGREPGRLRRVMSGEYDGGVRRRRAAGDVAAEGDHPGARPAGVAEASAARIFDLLDTPAAEVDPPGARAADFAARAGVRPRHLRLRSRRRRCCSDISLRGAQGRGRGAGGTERGGEDHDAGTGAALPRAAPRGGAARRRAAGRV